MKKIDRRYNIPDALLIEHAEKTVEVLPRDLGNFSEFDTTIDSAYPDSIREAIAGVYSVKSDNVLIDEMSAKTETLYKALGKCNRTYSTIAFFVRKAFPNDKSMANIFGANDIEKVRKSQERMIPFMHSLRKSSEKYRDRLISAGCRAEVIDNIPVLTEELTKANIEQEVFKTDRGLQTRERVTKLNNLYQKLLPLSEIAQIIFNDNNVLLETYLIPKPPGATKSKDNLLTEE